MSVMLFNEPEIITGFSKVCNKNENIFKRVSPLEYKENIDAENWRTLINVPIGIDNEGNKCTDKNFVTYIENKNLYKLFNNKVNYIGVIGLRYPNTDIERRDGIEHFFFISPFVNFKISEDNLIYEPLKRKAFNTDFIIHKTDKSEYYFHFNNFLILLKKDSYFSIYTEDDFGENIINSYLINPLYEYTTNSDNEIIQKKYIIY